MDIKAWFKKRKWDILTVGFIGLMFIPSVRTPVMVFVQRLIAGNPSEIAKEKQQNVKSFDWDLIDLDGIHSNLIESKGEVILINLWATWCPPCIAEMPAIQDLYDDYKDKIDFYLISNEDSEIITNFMQEKGFNMPIYGALSHPPSIFDSNSLPTTYVVDKEGKVVVKEIGAKDWNSQKFRKLLDVLLL